MSGNSSSPNGGKRQLKVKVKSARGRKISSTLWLQRQLNDPYVAEANRMGLRSRAAFKLSEINEKHDFLKPGLRVLDLGCAPGGWCQIAAEKVDSLNGKGKVLGIDLQEVDPIPGAELIVLDFLDEEAPDIIKEKLGGPVDIVLSDMAASASGHRQTDHLKIMALCEAALDFAIEVLNEDGVFLAKVLKGGTENELLNTMKKSFKTVRHIKPKASRANSAEAYVLATGFRGTS